MFQPIIQLCLMRGSPAHVNAKAPTIATFVTCLVVLAWLGGGGIGSGDPSDLSAEELSALQKVITVIPLLQHTIATLMILTVLNIRKFNNRFAQTITAYLGVQVLFQTLAVCMNVVSLGFPQGLAIVFGIVQLALMVWFFGVMGYVFKLAFNIKMYQGVLAAIVMMVLSYFLAGVTMSLLFPDAMTTLAELGQAGLVPASSD